MDLQIQLNFIKIPKRIIYGAHPTNANHSLDVQRIKKNQENLKKGERKKAEQLASSGNMICHKNFITCDSIIVNNVNLKY